MEIPTDLIKQVQISLRKHANLLSYDPYDRSFPNLPSPEEAVAALDPSPPYLRCRQCKGRLLRGVQSLICVFCGQEAFNDVVPDPLNFRNTLGYRWLLDSLNLDGSETVAPPNEANNSQRGRAAPNDEVLLSDLLDLEIKWPSELEKFGSRTSNETSVQSKSSLNFSGVNIENFFAKEEKEVATSNVSVEPSVFINAIEARETTPGHENLHLFKSAKLSETGHENLSLFENAKPSETSHENLSLFENAKSSETSHENLSLFENAKPSETSHENLSFFEDAQPSGTSVPSSEGEGKNYSDSGWGADFESATTAAAVHKESTSFDPLVGSADLSTKDSIGKKNEETIRSASMASDWIADGAWKNSNSGLIGTQEDFKMNTNVNNESIVETVNYSSSTNVNSVQDKRWQSNSKNESDSNADEDNDSFDDWNDFASSSIAQDPLSSTQKQTTMPSDNKTSEINLLSSADHPWDLNKFA